MLEQLPTEILQQIFEYSVNLELPRVSTRLESQLASTHLQHELTARILEPVLGNPYGSCKREVENATRLMNSRFFTWTFFQEWIQAMSESLTNPQALNSPADHVPNAPLEHWIWQQLKPNARLLPPRKVWKAPFGESKIDFLSVMLPSYLDFADEVDTSYLELVRDGLHQAVAEGAADALRYFWAFKIQPDTELLREAVIDAGCDKRVVSQLFYHARFVSSEHNVADFLDRRLWKWADEARRRGDEKGDWLMGELKEAARRSGQQSKDGQSVRDDVE